MTEYRKTVGILGGMGPEATIEFMRRLVAAVPATDDAAHIRMLVDNNPKVPSRIKALIEGTGDDPAPVLARMARNLETAGADFLAMPCNTAHAYLRQIEAAVAIPVLDMIGLSISALAEGSPRPRAVGLLASPAVRQTGVFAVPLSREGFETIAPSPEEEATLLALIKLIKAGRRGLAEQAMLHEVAGSLVARGAEALVIACSEFSLLPKPCIEDRFVLDTLDVLVRETLSAAA